MDLSGLKSLRKTLNTIKSHHIEYGIVEGQTYPNDGSDRSGMPVAEIAMQLEVGLSKTRLPPRPFFKQSLINEGYDVARDGSIDILSAAVNGRYTKRMMSDLSNELAATVKRSINSQNFEPLRPKTVAKKGNSMILVESSKLYNSLTGKVRKGSI